MIRKTLLGTFIVPLLLLIVTGCGQRSPAQREVETQAIVDSVSSASVVDSVDGFVRAAGPNGTWIIAVTKDLATDGEIVVSGQFTRQGVLYRKLALYAQDENRTVTARYTLSAQRLVVNSENTRIQEGTFVGDVYVRSPGFHLVGATVDGNVYFETQELRDSFEMDEASQIIGELRVGAPASP